MPLNIEIEVQDCETLTLEVIDASMYPSVRIDDAAGLGDTDVTWSADKSSRELDDKVDKVDGKQLSDENYTLDDKTKLAGVADKIANPNPNMFEVVSSQVYAADSLLMRVRPSGVSNADRELAVCIPYSHKRGALYQIGREINDRLIRRLIVYSADHGAVETLPISGGDVEPYITNGDKTGTWIRDGFRNNFTTELGATVSCTFIGTGISFAFYRDDRGGVWGVSVDGVAMPDISTWSAEPGYPGLGFETAPGIVKVASGLPLGEHTVTLTFKGADPLHEPSGGTARGWVIQFAPTDTNGDQWRAYGTFRILNLINDVAVTDAITMAGSNIEFAVLCRPADSPSVPLTWFPEHGGVPGVITILSSKITVDGVAIDLDSPGIFGDPGWHRAGVVQIVQTFTAQNPAQPSRPLVNGSMLMSVTPKGLAISVVMDVLEDLYVAQGYSLMPSAIAADSILTGVGEFRQLGANDGVIHPLNDSNTGVMYSSSLNDFVVAWEVMNPMQSQRVGKPASVSPWTAVADRELGRLKQYNFIAQNGVIPAGERIVMMGRERCVEIGNPDLVFLPSV